MCALRHSQSLELRLKSEGKLGNAVRRQAFPLLEQLYSRIEPALWRERDAVASGIIDEEGQRLHRLSSETETAKNQHLWFSRSLDFIEKDKELSAALAAQAARRGDNEVPESMRPARQPTEMEKIYRTMPDTPYHVADARVPAYSRLQLRDIPVLSDDAPREGGGHRYQQTPTPPAAQAPTKDVLSLSELSKKLLPRHLQVPEKTGVTSKTVALPARTTW
jgi:hypothetical protein